MCLQGVFLFPNGFKKMKHVRKKTMQSNFESMFDKELWYITYKHNWNVIEEQLKVNEELNHIMTIYSSN